MANFKELLLGALASTLETVGETKLVEVLQELHDKNPETYQQAIIGGRALCEALEPIVAKTGTKIDDSIINALKEAIEISSSSNT